MIAEDGSFRLNYVPEGSYLLKVIGDADSEPRNGADTGGGNFARLLNSKPVRTYGSASMPLSLTGDATGSVLQVPDAGTKPAQSPE
jgi:hypothetical protein